MTDHQDPSDDGGDGSPMKGGGRRSRQWAFGTAPRPKAVVVAEQQAALAHREEIAIGLDLRSPTRSAVLASIVRAQDAARSTLGGALDPRRAMAMASAVAASHAWMPASRTRYENDPGPVPATRYENDPGLVPATRYDDPGLLPATRYENEPGLAPATRYENDPGLVPATRYDDPGLLPATRYENDPGLVPARRPGGDPVYGDYAPRRPPLRALPGLDGARPAGGDPVYGDYAPRRPPLRARPGLDGARPAGPAWTPAATPARYETTPMLARYAGEHLPGNAIWSRARHVTYLGEDEREARRVVVHDGRLHWLDGTPVDTASAKSAFVGGGGRAIFVMDRQGNLYASTFHKAGQFHHSSLLAGAPVAAAGEMEVQDGVVTLITDRSGHYQPSPPFMLQLLTELEHQGLPLDAIQYPGEGEGAWVSAQQAADQIRSQLGSAPHGAPGAATQPPASAASSGMVAPGSPTSGSPPAGGTVGGGTGGAAHDGGHGGRADGGYENGPDGGPTDGQLRGDERSGVAETRGDEARLGPGGEADRGKKNPYSRWVGAFGRDPEGARAGFQQHWERVAQERAASAVAQQAAKGSSVRDQVGAAIGEALEHSYEELPELFEASPALDGDLAPPADAMAGLDAGEAPAAPGTAAAPGDAAAPHDAAAPGAVAARPPSRGRRFVRAAARNWSEARRAARDLGAGFRLKLKQLRHGLRRDTGDHGQGAFRADRLPPSNKWTVLEESDVARDDAGSKKHDLPRDDEDRTNVNRVDKVVFKEAIPGTDTKLGFFKPESRTKPDSDHTDNFEVGDGEPARLASRAVLSSALDQALGTGVLAVEVFGRLRNPETGLMETGNVSAGAPGRALQGNIHQDLSAPLKDRYHVANVVKELNNSVDLRSPAVQEGLTDLQTVDWLTGQSDRHGGNIFVTDDGKVTGIDNDFAFGAADQHRVGFGDPGRQIGGQNVGIPPVMSRKTADAVLGMTPERMKQILDGSVPPGERLAAGEMAAAQSRLEKLQQAIRDGSVEVVTAFDDRTYDALRTLKELKGRGELAQSYVETHASLVEAAAAGQLPPERIMVDLERYKQVVTVNEDPNADVSSLAPSHAKNDVLALPDSPYAGAAAAPPAEGEASDASLADVVMEGLDAAARDGGEASGDVGGARLDAGSMPVIDGSAPAEQASSAAPIGDVATAVEANVRRGRSASESQAAGATGRADRSSFTLKRRSHAGTSARTDAKKTPARGTKDRRSMPVTRTKRKKG